jgi:hypothetical protein
MAFDAIFVQPAPVPERGGGELVNHQVPRGWLGSPVILKNEILGDHAESVPEEDINVQSVGTPVGLGNTSRLLGLIVEIVIQGHDVLLQVAHCLVESPAKEKGGRSQGEGRES